MSALYTGDLTLHTNSHGVESRSAESHSAESRTITSSPWLRAMAPCHQPSPLRVEPSPGDICAVQQPGTGSRSLAKIILR